MRFFRFLFNFILSFLLIISIFLNFAINTLKNNILEKQYIINKMKEVGYYNQLFDEINSGFENYIYQSGLPTDTIKELFTIDDLKGDVNIAINHIYDNAELTNKKEQVRANLDNKVQSYISTQNIKVDNLTKSNIEKFEDLIVKEYDEGLMPSEKLFDYLKLIVSISKMIVVYEKYIRASLIIIIVLLVIVNIKNLIQAVNFVGISIFVLGILELFSINYINKSIKFDNLVIVRKSFTNLVVNLAKEIMYKYQDTAKLMAFIGGFTIILTIVLMSFDKEKRDFLKNINPEIKPKQRKRKELD